MNKLIIVIYILFLICMSITNIYSQTAEEFADSGFRKYAIQDYSGAIADYSNAISLNSKNDSYYIIRGYSNFKFKNYKDAINDFSKAIELCPNYYTYYLNRASAKQLISDKEGACADYKKYLEVSGLPPNEEIMKYCEGLINSTIENK